MADFSKRNEQIGGSEIAAILGMSRWKSPLQLWAEKTGEIEQEDISEKEYVQLGTELEDFVAKKFERETGLKVRRDSRTFRFGPKTYMVAHIDRRITGTDALLECKTCSMWKEHEWEGEGIPQEYILQVIWYLGILEMKKGYIAVLIGGQKFRWKEIDFDPDLFEQMVEKAEAFMDMVKTKTPPMAIAGDKDLLNSMYAETPDNPYDPSITEMEEMDQLLINREEIKAEMDVKKVQIEEIENKIKQTLGECDTVNLAKHKVSWKYQKSKRVDTDKLKEEGIYDDYCKISTSRVFRVSKKKEK